MRGCLHELAIYACVAEKPKATKLVVALVGEQKHTPVISRLLWIQYGLGVSPGDKTRTRSSSVIGPLGICKYAPKFKGGVDKGTALSCVHKYNAECG